MSRVYLSPPHVNGLELPNLADALASNWIAPAGPHLDAFEQEFASLVGVRHAVALNSGTAALHLALLAAGIGTGDDVLVSTLTVAASVNPICYLGAHPVLIDSEAASWTLDAELAASTIAARARLGRAPKALVLVHLYGQCADIAPVRRACDEYGVVLIEDAAEALGSTYHGHPAGAFGRAAIFSFNGNKLVTTSAGGMLVSDDEALVARARIRASQAREPVRHYEHRAVGYNYRMSNLLAAVGRAQLSDLPSRVDARRRVFDWYVECLGDLPGVSFMPEATWGRSSRWLTTLTIDPALAGYSRDTVIERLEAADIESRPVWKPMHQQPVFAACDTVGGAVADRLFEQGLCLPSGTGLTRDDVVRVATIVRHCGARA